jgi:type I restriction enzyme R subunit
MSNFAFLKPEWTDLFDAARRAETAVRNDARSSCFYARRALELALEWLYQHDSSLKRPYDNNLSALIYEPSFKNALTSDLFLKVKTIKDVGNIAVHSRKAVAERDALRVTKELFHFLYWMARTYTRQTAANYHGLNFDEAKVPPQITATVKQTVEQLKKLEEELRQKDAELAKSALALADTDAQIAQLKKEIAEAKKKNEAIPDDHDYSEAETRAYFIDLLLHEAGWPLDKPEDREYEVTGMPNETGIGYVDYVLWGADGKPLAIVEAKRTTVDARVGRQQAKLYADCLERMTGQRPLIFYTNGYQTWFWDDQNYPPREVQGFYKRDELELLLQRRTTRQELTNAAVNEAIVERYYQIEAITRVSEHFARQQRKALIVMATGAGKTRTVIALCELLQRCNWIKRVLFLADRVALVKQACNAFKKHLPDASPVNLVTERNATGSRVYVSTYPTMMNLINQMEGDTRRFGVGYFDLIVIDEAHRSIYQKYRAIFEYFDALLVGLTATPKDEVDRNTYSLFDLEKGAPTFAYELDQAVADGFLVPPRPLELDLKFIREGIKYDDLSEEEQEQWDAMEWDEDGVIPDAVESAALNKWFFNEDTVDKALATLMQHGQKVAGGDVLGKTIIFAKNHQHALFIQERFDQHYPHYKGAFARVIDNYEPYAESLLDDFSNVDKRPQIAISVDMLDTGVDIPEAVNLMFFKMVRSKTKFFQMIGRGTRLRPDLFGPSEDKEFFYIFDCCRNFEFFNQSVKGIEGNSQDSLSTKLFKTRLELLESFRHMKSDDAEIKALDQDLADTLCREVAAMNTNNFVVRPHRQQVEKYRESAAWEQLDAEEFDEIAHILAGLPSELEAEDETAKRFDLTMLKLQLSLLNIDVAFTRLSTNVKEIASRLEEKQSIPMVREQLELILDLQQDEYWSDITLPMLEDVRRRLRDLVKFIEKKQRKILTSDFTDELGDLREVGLSGITTAADREQYRRKVTHFLRAHENHITIHKLKRNLTITPSDIAEIERIFFASGELGTREDFERAYGKQEHLGLFIRKLVGLDREAAKEAFGEYLAQKVLSANQIRFIDQIIDYLTQNGVMEPEMLYKSPFTDYSPVGLDGIFDDREADGIVTILHQIWQNAAAA